MRLFSPVFYGFLHQAPYRLIVRKLQKSAILSCWCAKRPLNHLHREDAPMTFADLLATLETRGALPRAGERLKTSLRYLAAALGQAGLEQCHVGAACRRKPRGRGRWRPISRRSRRRGGPSVRRRGATPAITSAWSFGRPGLTGSSGAPAPPPPYEAQPRRTSGISRGDLAVPGDLSSPEAPAGSACPRHSGPPISRPDGGPTRRRCGLRLRAMTLRPMRGAWRLSGLLAHVVAHSRLGGPL